MSAMEYGGPERRRGGPDRRNVGEQRTRILIVDDHALFRVGIANILNREPDLDIVGEADDSRSAVDRALETSPDIVLMDLSLPAPGGGGHGTPVPIAIGTCGGGRRTASVSPRGS